MSRVHGNRRNDPPSEWPGVGANYAGHDVYWRSAEEYGEAGDVDSILVWHWCPCRPVDPDDVDGGHWSAAGVADHTLLTMRPLHLEPSLLWRCCGKHGWIRNGAWTDA